MLRLFEITFRIYDFLVKFIERKLKMAIFSLVLTILLIIGSMFFGEDKIDSEVSIESTTSSQDIINKNNSTSTIISFCQEQNDGEYYREYSIANCIEDEALKFADYELCNLQNDFRSEQSREFFMSNCISKVAVQRDDLQKCSTLPTDSSDGTRASCYGGLALKHKDISICDNIVENEKYRPKYSCQSEVYKILAQENPSICKTISNKELQYDCLSHINKDNFTFIKESDQSNWNTYQSDYYNFSFRYPNELTLFEFDKNVSADKIKFVELDSLVVSVYKPEDYRFHVGVDVGNFKYLSEKNIWFDEFYGDMCKSDKINKTNFNVDFFNKGFKYTKFSTGDMCASVSDYIFITADEKLVVISTLQDCDVTQEEITLQDKIVQSFEIKESFESVCI